MKLFIHLYLINCFSYFYLSTKYCFFFAFWNKEYREY